MFRSILVGVDGSEHANAALTQAIDLAAAQGSKLTLLSAWQPLTTWYVVGMVPVVTDHQDLFDSVELEARRVLEAAREKVPANVPAEALLVSGPAAQAILDQATRGDHDLVVLGSRGRGSVATLLLGSVSQNVLHHSRVPVMIVHAQPSVVKDAELEAKELDTFLLIRPR